MFHSRIRALGSDSVENKQPKGAAKKKDTSNNWEAFLILRKRFHIHYFDFKYGEKITMRFRAGLEPSVHILRKKQTAEGRRQKKIQATIWKLF